MKISDIPAEDAANFLGAIVARNASATERYPFQKLKIDLHLSKDEARIIFAGSKWLETYLQWNVGVEETEPSLPNVVKFMAELVDKIKAQAERDEIVLALKQSCLATLRTAVLHLDRYAVKRSFPEQKPYYSKGKRK